MMLGLSLPAFTILHVLISLVGIVTGLIATLAFVRGRWLARTTDVFLVTTLATTLSGFLFPFKGFTPAIGVGIISTAILLAVFAALYVGKLRGGARTVYAVTAVTALYLNIFVLFVQSFQKIPVLRSLAPAGNEPPFVAAQGALLISVLLLGYLCFRSARHWATPAATA